MRKIVARDRQPGSATQVASETVEQYLQIDLPRLMFWLRAGIRWIVIASLVGLLLGTGYAILAKPRFTVTADILIDPSGLQIVSDDLFRQNEQQRDAQLLNVESKRQTLLSRNVLLRTINSLSLQDDPEFVPPASLFSVSAILGVGDARRSPEIVALENLRRQVSARRDEVSFVITMSLWTRDPEKSIRISEAIIESFKEELIAADSEGASRSANALADRLSVLKGDVSDAEEAVEEFRRQQGLSSAQGELVSSRSMSQINQQLVEARGRLISAESRYRELTSNNASDIAALQSSTIAELRARYATLKSQADGDALTYGLRHPRLVSQQSELRALQNEIEAERNRIVQAARNDLEQARAVVEALNAQASLVSSNVFSDNDAEVRLRELVRDAAAKTSIYEAFLLRVREVTERQQLDTTNIRVISAPVMPRARSWPPRTIQAGGFGALAGMVTGILGVLAFAIAADLGGNPNRVSQSRAAAARRPSRTGSDTSEPRPTRPTRAPRRPMRPGSLLDLPGPELEPRLAAGPNRYRGIRPIREAEPGRPPRRYPR